MSEHSRLFTSLPPEQQAIRAKCFHPTGTFVELRKEDIEQSIPDRFEKIIRLYTRRLAIKTKNRSLTYEALNQAANRIARAILAKRGAGEEPVALLLEHGADVIAAILAVLKAGKIYVPLDPTLPRARTNYILEDTGSGLIVTNTPNLSYAAQIQNGRDLVNIDELGVGSSTENVVLSISPDKLAYILYTSGSAGQPKGVVQNHRNLLNQIKRETNSLHICADDRLTLLRSCSAIGGVRVILSALLNGAAVYPLNIAEDGQAKLCDLLLQEEITIYDSAATPFRHFAAALTAEESFPKLRLIRISSEPVYKGDVELYKKHFSPGCIFVNSLGLTETAGTIRNYFIDHESQPAGSIVPVGYAVEDMEIRLLDDQGHEVRGDDTGEIAVRSRYLSPGYWQRPDLTQAKFLSDPERCDERICLTGDFGRMLPDGCLVHVGRKDSQVKIRGYRIDVAEIELVLRALDAIKEAAVVTRENPPDEHDLVAYLVPKKKPSPTVSSLRRALSETLPDYMVPSAFVMLDAMPLTPTGKVDRGALPESGRTRPELEVTFVSPRTAAERSLAEIWREVLHIDKVGIHDDFFDLGGHSLLAVRLFEQIEKEFSQRLPLSSLFQSATIEHLAGLIGQATPWPAVVPLQPQGSKLPFFCVHEFFGDVLCYMNLARHLGQDQPFYALQARGLDGIEEPFTDIKTMAAYYIEEIRPVQPQGPYALGGLCSGGIVAFEMAQQLRAKGEAVAMVALLDSTATNRANGKITGSWSFLHNLLRDLPSWLIGSMQLNRSQWLNLIKLKLRMGKARRSSDGGSYQDYVSKLIKEMGDLFHFSEQHRKVARAQSRALREYGPRVYPGRLTLFRARMQPLFSSHDPEKGWGHLAAGGVDIKVVPGNHLGMLQEPHVRVLAEELRACLERAQSSNTFSGRTYSLG